MCKDKIKECIRLLKISGENTKAEVLKILEGLLDDKRLRLVARERVRRT